MVWAIKFISLLSIKQVLVFLSRPLLVTCQSNEPLEGEQIINLARKVFKVTTV
jgi:hypothetical protein